MDTKKKKETIKETFFKLLGESVKTLLPSKDEKAESQTSDDYNDKQTHQHKVEDAED